MALPARVGRYEILGLIGTGGMAEVLLGRFRGPNGFERPVVVKRILPHLAREKPFRDMFLDEARIIAGIRHKNVVQVQELGQDGEDLYLVMEYLEGESLAGLTRRLSTQNKRLAPPLCAYVIAEACAGLHAAHETRGMGGRLLNLVHRDVSPSNIFVTYGGDVKILDFGIAVVADRLSRTEAGKIKGKYAYMSPEQCNGLQLDRRSDLFSLGTVLYELSTCRRLFKRATDLLTAQAICTEDANLPSRVVRDFPQDLDAISRRALQRNRDLRYGSADEMRRELLHVAHRLGDTTPPAEKLSRVVQGLFPDRIAQKQRMLARVVAGHDVADVPPAETDAQIDLPLAVTADLANDTSVTVATGAALPSDAPVPQIAHVLVVDGSGKRRSHRLALLESHGVRAFAAPTAEDAVAQLVGGSIDVLVASQRLDGRSGTQLVQMAREASPETRSILCIDNATAAEYKAASEAAVVEILDMSANDQEFIAATNKALAHEGFQASVEGVELTDILQMFHQARYSRRVRLQDGEIIMERGEITHAQCGNVTGTEALRSLLDSQSGSIMSEAFVAGPNHRPTINEPFGGLLLSLATQFDEGRRTPAPKKSVSTEELLSAHPPIPTRVPLPSHRPLPVPEPVPTTAPTSSPVALATFNESANDANSDVEAINMAQPPPQPSRLIYMILGAALVAVGVLSYLLLQRDEGTQQQRDRIAERTTPVDRAPVERDGPVKVPIHVKTVPSGLELVQAKTGLGIGRSPVRLILDQDEAVTLKAKYKGKTSASFRVSGSEGSPTIDLTSWTKEVRDAQDSRPAPVRRSRTERRSRSRASRRSEPPPPVVRQDRPTLLLVTTEPSRLNVAVDGEVRDMTPTRVDVSPGSHQIQILRGKDVVLQRNIKIKEGDVVTLNEDVTDVLARMDAARASAVEASRSGPEAGPLDDDGKLNLVELIERDSPDSKGAVEPAPPDSALPPPRASGSPTMLVYSPGQDASRVRSALGSSVGGVRVRVASRASDLSRAISAGEADAIIAPASVLRANGLTGSMKGRASSTSYIAASFNTGLSKQGLLSMTVGVVDELGRKRMPGRVASILGVKSSPRLRRVSKLEDLASLLQLGQADAVLVPSGQIAEIESRTTRPLKKIRFASTGAQMAVGFVPGASRSAVEGAVRALSSEANETLGVSGWTK